MIESRHESQRPPTASELLHQYPNHSVSSLTTSGIMSGISGISGFGGVDPSAWIAMNAATSVTATSTSAVGSALGTTATESLALSSSFQALVETIRTFGTIEVLLALLLTARKDHRPTHELCSANLLSGLALAGFLSQRILLPSFEALPCAVATPSINVTG